jgi:hypothetical protein
VHFAKNQVRENRGEGKILIPKSTRRELLFYIIWNSVREVWFREGRESRFWWLSNSGLKFKSSYIHMYKYIHTYINPQRHPDKQPC